jgi:cell division transport system permease protein
VVVRLSRLVAALVLLTAATVTLTIGAARGTRDVVEPDEKVPMMNVYFEPGVDQAIVQDMDRRLRAMPEVRNLEYVGPVRAIDEFRRIFAEEPDVRDSLTVDQIPTSFRFRLIPPDAQVRNRIRDPLEDLPGVFRVESTVFQDVRAEPRGQSLLLIALPLLLGAAILLGGVAWPVEVSRE